MCQDPAFVGEVMHGAALKAVRDWADSNPEALKHADLKLKADNTLKMGSREGPGANHFMYYLNWSTCVAPDGTLRYVIERLLGLNVADVE